MRAIGYFREIGSASLAEQSAGFLAFCKQNGYEAAAAFLEPKGTADSPGFHQMVDFVRQQAAAGFLVVVVPGLNALGSPVTDAARRYFQLASLGVSVISIETGDEISGALLEAWADNRSTSSLGDRVKAAMRRRAIKGEAVGRPPYGYRVGGRKRLEVVPDEGSVVRYIFRLYVKDGLGIRRIARRLNEENLRTRRNGLWSMVTVRDILRNRAYVGTYSRFGVRVPASHPPLISQEDFQRVQEKLDQRKPAGDVRQISPFLLSGVIYCGYCGNKMIGVTRKQRWKRQSDGELRSAQYRYYQCESRTNRSLCDYHTWRAEKLEGVVRQSLLSGAGKQSRSGSRNGTDVESGEGAIRRLRDRARRLDRRLEQYMDAAANGSINREKLFSLGLALAVEQLQVEDHISESARAIQQQLTHNERIARRDGLLSKLNDEWDEMSFPERQELYRDLVARIVVHDKSVETILRP